MVEAGVRRVDTGGITMVDASGITLDVMSNIGYGWSHKSGCTRIVYNTHNTSIMILLASQHFDHDTSIMTLLS